MAHPPDIEQSPFQELPLEVKSSILCRVRLDTLTNVVPMVCKEWCAILKEATFWRDVVVTQHLPIPDKVCLLSRHILDHLYL